MEAPSEDESGRGVSDQETCLLHADLWRAGSQATGAILLSGSNCFGAAEQVRKAQLIDHPSLLVPLPIAEVEHAVAANRTAVGKTELPALKERIGISRIAIEGGIRGKRVIPEEVKQRAMPLVSAGAGDYINCAGEGDA